MPAKSAFTLNEKSEKITKNYVTIYEKIMTIFL